MDDYAAMNLSVFIYAIFASRFLLLMWPIFFRSVTKQLRLLIGHANNMKCETFFCNGQHYNFIYKSTTPHRPPAPLM